MLLPLLRLEHMPVALAALATAEPLATCKALSRVKELSIITPQMAAHTLGGLARPEVSLAIRKELARYFEAVIQTGVRTPIVHEIYMVLLILNPIDTQLRRCAPYVQMDKSLFGMKVLLLFSIFSRAFRHW